MAFTVEDYIEAKRVGAPHAGRVGSPRTLHNYKCSLRTAEFLLKKPIAEFVEEDGQAFLHEAHRLKYKQSSINAMLAPLKAVFAWGIGTKQYTGPNPFSYIMTTTPHREIPTLLNEQQMQCLFSTIEKDASRKFMLILMLMGYSGLRISEALTLKKEDVLDDGILIIGKGSKPAFVPVRDDLLNAIKAFVADNPDTDYVFYGERHGDKNQPMQANIVYVHFRDAAKKCALPRDIRPHTLRHSFATLALNKTKRIEVVQDLLRHKDPKTTRFYAQVSNDELKGEYSKIWGK